MRPLIKMKNIKIPTVKRTVIEYCIFVNLGDIMDASLRLDELRIWDIVILVELTRD